jgi:hypothetical protein
VEVRRRQDDNGGRGEAAKGWMLLGEISPWTLCGRFGVPER